jgi:hypothetical protein
MGTLKAIFGLIVVGAVVYAVYLFIPPYFNNYQLQDDVRQVAKFDAATPKNEDDIRKEVQKAATGHGITLSDDQVQVARDGQAVTIVVDYQETVEVPQHPVVIKFHYATNGGTTAK